MGIKKIDFALIECLLYKLLTSSKGCEVLSIGFYRSMETPEEELTKVTVPELIKIKVVP